MHSQRRGEPADGERIDRTRASLFVEPERRVIAGAAEGAADQYVGEDRLAVEGDGRLESSRHAQPADVVGAQALDLAVLEFDRAAGGGVDARYAVEERGLAGAIGPDDGEHLAGLNGQWQVGGREQPSLSLADLLALQDGHGLSLV